MKLRVLGEADVRSVIDMAAAIEIQERAFASLGAGEVISGLRSFARLEDPSGVAIFNPAVLRDGGGYGIKIVSDFEGNDALRVTRLTALVALFDGRTGHPRTVMEGGHLTDLRTGGGTGLAARHLARADSRVLALVGAGRVARFQAMAIANGFPLEKVLIASRTGARAERLAELLVGDHGWPRERVEIVGGADEAVSRADIVVTATTSPRPTFSAGALRAGTFVAAVGAHSANTRELETETVARASRLVIDSRADCLDNAGDFVIPAAEGAIDRGAISELGEVVSGRAPGRRGDDEITCFKSVGVPVQDLVTAQAIEERAVAAGIGTVIEIGGEYP